MTRRERRDRADALPSRGERFIDPHGVTWTVAAIHREGAQYVTLQAGALRRTMPAARFRALEWSRA